MHYLKQSTAGQEVLLGPFVDDSDGKTAETSLTIANTDIKIWKEGATTEASKNSGGATHIASGRYYAVLDATDTDTIGKLEINVAVSGALPVMRQFHVLHANVYDWMFGSEAPLNAAGVRSAVGLSSANLDTQLGDLPTVAEFEARTLPTADYFDPSTDTVTVGTNNDKTGYSISGTITTLDALDTAQDSQHTATQSAISNLNDLSAAEVNAEVDTALADYDALVPADLPDNFASLGINASGHIERVTLVDTTTANTDMRGTDSAYTGTPPTAASIADAVWDEAQADHDGAGTFGAYLDASVSGVSTGGVSASDIADAVWDEALSGHVDAGSAGAELAATYSGTPPTAESISTQVASDLASAHGSGSWETATGFATPTNVTDAQSAIIAHGDGDGAWGATGAGDAAPTVDEIATRLLVSPANKLATNSDGSVNATVSGVDVDEEALADALIEAGVASQASVDAIKAKTDLLGTAGVTFHAPVASDATVSVRRSRDYHNSDGRALEWTNADGTWPDLTDATFKVLLAEPGKVTAKYVFSGTVVTPAGAGQKVRLELTDTQLAINADDYVYEGKVTLASGNVIDLPGVSGPFSVLLGMDEPA